MNKSIKQLLEYIYDRYKDDIYYSVKTESLNSLIDEIVSNCFRASLYNIKNSKAISNIAKQKFGDITSSVGWSDNINECQSFEDYKLFYIYVKFRDNRVIYFGNYEQGRQQHTIMDGEELTKFAEYLQELVNIPRA